MPPATRRTLLRGAALASATAAGLGLTGCETRDPGDPELPTEPVELGPASEVPVGGARIYPEHKVLVSRPSEEDYRAYSAVCTHAGCVLSGTRDLEADCACHGSRFDSATGRVLQGPAHESLPEIPLRSENGRLIAGPAA
ncbi:Rieske (2Fe-2S) protein [Streptomyces sp. ACA25]|nr:Rieske (2Fe-2S) protein [Streptomyces sp. ACA25]MDB1088511.1 Rieske (2Fe-2S) protein [Streptomyces sp. ACA25]